MFRILIRNGITTIYVPQDALERMFRILIRNGITTSAAL